MCEEMDNSRLILCCVYVKICRLVDERTKISGLNGEARRRRVRGLVLVLVLVCTDTVWKDFWAWTCRREVRR